MVVWFSNNEDRGFKNNSDLLHNAGTQRGPNDLALSWATKAGVPCKKAGSYIHHSQQARKLKKVQAKKLVKSNKSKILLCEIAFLAVLNFFPVQKLGSP